MQDDLFRPVGTAAGKEERLAGWRRRFLSNLQAAGLELEEARLDLDIEQSLTVLCYSSSRAGPSPGSTW